MPIMVVSALAMSLLIGSPASRALYVADFSAAERGDSGKLGGVWLVRPNSR